MIKAMENATLSLVSVGEGRSSHTTLSQKFSYTMNITNGVTHNDMPSYVTHDVTHDDMSHGVTGAGLPMTLYIAAGVVMVIVFLLGTLGNIFVIIVFGCFRSLRKPMNILLVNLAVANLLMAFFGSPMVALSAFHGHWVFGDIWCQVNAFCMGQWGLVSIVTMAVIALERVCGVASYGLRSPLQRCGAPGTVLLIWCYSTVWVLPPLWGWGHYTLESHGIACSFKFEDPTWEDRWFLVYLVLGGFLVPCCIILVSYSLLWGWVLHNQRSFQRQAARMKTSVRLMRANSCSDLELRVTKMCGLVVLVFLIAWLPYVVVTLVAAFGTEAQAALITPVVCMLTGIFAKMSSIYTPMLYTVRHQAFRERLWRVVCQRSLCDSPNLSIYTAAYRSHASESRTTCRSTASLVHTTTFMLCRPVLTIQEVGDSGIDSGGKGFLMQVLEEDNATNGHTSTIYCPSSAVDTDSDNSREPQ